jgi:hypothetical protein
MKNLFSLFLVLLCGTSVVCFLLAESTEAHVLSFFLVVLSIVASLINISYPLFKK